MTKVNAKMYVCDTDKKKNRVRQYLMNHKVDYRTINSNLAGPNGKVVIVYDDAVRDWDDINTRTVVESKDVNGMLFYQAR